jgi:hypothetical protein
VEAAQEMPCLVWSPGYTCQPHIRRPTRGSRWAPAGPRGARLVIIMGILLIIVVPGGRARAGGVTSSIHASTHSHLHVPWLSHHPIAHPITPLAGSLCLLGRCRQHRRLVEACGGCLPVERGDARDLVRRKGESPCTTTGWRSLIRGSWDPPLIMGPPCIFSPCELGIEVQQRVH